MSMSYIPDPRQESLHDLISQFFLLRKEASSILKCCDANWG